jgi:hypothetical protein
MRDAEGKGMDCLGRCVLSDSFPLSWWAVDVVTRACREIAGKSDIASAWTMKARVWKDEPFDGLFHMTAIPLSSLDTVWFPMHPKVIQERPRSA